MNPDLVPEMFPVYEDVDAEYIAGVPDLSYPVDYGYANLGDDLDDDTLSDIYIEDEAYAEDDFPVDDFEHGPWLPYNPSSNPGSGSAQQIVLGGGIPIYPPAGELTESYCRFYPRECAGKIEALPQVNSTCIPGANGSDPNCTSAEGADGALYPALKSVDLSGVGMVLLIALLLLIGVHFGWDSDKGKQSKGRGDEPPRPSKRDTPERPSKSDGKGKGDTGEPNKEDGNREPRRLRDPAADPRRTDGRPTDSPPKEKPEDPSPMTPTEKEKQRAQAALDRARKEQKRAQESGDAEAIRRADEKVKKAEERLRRATEADNRAKVNVKPGEPRPRGEKGDEKGRPSRGTPAGGDTNRGDRKKGSENPERSTASPPRDSEPPRREKDTPGGQPSKPERPPDAPKSSRTPAQQAADEAVASAERNLKAAKEAENRAKAKAIRDEERRTGVRPTSTPKTPEVEAARKRRKEAEAALEQAKKQQRRANEDAQNGSGGQGGQGGRKPEEDRPERGKDRPSRQSDDKPPEGPKRGPSKTKEPSRPSSEPPGGTDRPAKTPRTEPGNPERPSRTPKDPSRSNDTPAGPTPAQKAADTAVAKATERLKRAQEAETIAKSSGDKGAAEKARRVRKAAQTELAKAQADKDLADANAAVEAAEKDLEKAKSAERGAPKDSEARELARKERKEAERKLHEAKKKQEQAQGKRNAFDAGKTERQIKADQAVADAQAELEKAKEAVKEAKASKDPKKESKANEQYERAREKYNRAKKEKEEADKEAAKSQPKQDEAKSTESGGLTPTKILAIFLLLIVLIGLLGRNLTMPSRNVADPIFRPPTMTVPKASSRSWTASSKPPPHISVNNIHAEGTDIPINIGTSDPEPVVVVTDSGSPIIEHYEPLEFHFTGPSSPDRVVGMLIGLVVAAGPLILDWARDWPDRSTFWTEYIPAMYHSLVLGLLLTFGLLAAERRYDVSAQYGYKLASRVRGVGDMLGPAVVATVETSEHLVWGAEDFVFGDSRYVVGAVVAVGLVVASTMREPAWDGDPSEYASAAVQFMYMVGLFLVGVILWNA